MSLKSIIQKYATTFSIVVIVFIALVLRLYQLDYQSLWVDEIASMNGTDPDQSWAAVITYSVSDQPPAFFLLLHAWFKVFPFTDFYGRLLSVVLGIAGILAIFFLGKEVKDSRTGLVSALITSFSFIHILFSQEARFYTLVFLFSILSYYFFIRAVKNGLLSNFILYSFSTTLLIYTHYFGLVVIVSQGLIFLLLIAFYPSDRKFIFLSILSAILIIFMIIPWIPIFFSDAQTKSFWIQHESFYFPFKYFYVYFKDVPSSVIYAILIILYFSGLYKKFKSGPIDRTDLILVSWLVFSFLIPITYSIIQTPMLQVRYTLIALPAIIILISLGLNHLKPSTQNILLIVTCCTSLFSLLVIEKYYTKIRKEDWRGMTNEVIQSSTPSDQYVSGKAWYCNYYFKSYNSPIRAISPNEFDSADQKPQRIWWLDGFDIRQVPDSFEVNLMRRGYFLKKTDSLYLTRASCYQLR